jgi:hypothetical protein
LATVPAVLLTCRPCFVRMHSWSGVDAEPYRIKVQLYRVEIRLYCLEGHPYRAQRQVFGCMLRLFR